MGIQSRKKILIVDDVPANLKILAQALNQDYQIVLATRGADAIQVATTSTVDIILLDVEMPGLDGFEVCRRLQENVLTRDIPVIFTTTRCSPEDIANGLMLGAFYYLTKPVNFDVLRAVIRSALKRGEVRRCLLGMISKSQCFISATMREAHFSIQTLDESMGIAAFLSAAYPNPHQASLGIRELLVNAIEHGHLGISYEEKSILNQSGTWEEEINFRLRLPEHGPKRVQVLFTHEEKWIRLRITDSGRGFDWKRFMDFTPERLLDSHGRGIAIAAKSAFDELNYFGSGNQVEAIVHVDE